MMRSLFSGVSGLKNHQTRMDVIGNNISNVNTTGFKSSRVTFTDMLSQTLTGASSPQENIGGTNPKQIGLGSSVAAVDVLFTNGSVQSTGKNTDLCLSGNGLFVVKDSSGTYYTRNGAFEFDAEGNYVLPGNGMFVQGWMADNGSLNTSNETTNITIPSGKSMEAVKSSRATYANNLNSSVPTIMEVTGGTNKLTTPEDGSASATPKTPITLHLSNGETIEVTEGTWTVGDVYADAGKPITHKVKGDSVTVTDNNIPVTAYLKGGKEVTASDSGNGWSFGYKLEAPSDNGKSATANGTNQVTLTSSFGKAAIATPGTYTVGLEYPPIKTNPITTPASVEATGDANENIVWLQLDDGTWHDVTAKNETYKVGVDTFEYTDEDGTLHTGTVSGYTQSFKIDSIKVLSPSGPGAIVTVGGIASRTVDTDGQSVAATDDNEVTLTLANGETVIGKSGEVYTVGKDHESAVNYNIGDKTGPASSTNRVHLILADNTTVDDDTTGTDYKVGDYYYHKGETTPSSATVTKSGAASDTNRVHLVFEDDTPYDDSTSGIDYEVGQTYHIQTGSAYGFSPENDGVHTGAASDTNQVLLMWEDGTETLDSISGTDYVVGQTYGGKKLTGFNSWQFADKTVKSFEVTEYSKAKINGFSTLSKITSIQEDIEVTQVDETSNVPITVTEIDTSVTLASADKPVTVKLSDGSSYTQTTGRYSAGWSMPVVTTMTVYDTLGASHDVTVYFTKTETDSINGNKWTVSVNPDGSGKTVIKEPDGTETIIEMPDATLEFKTTGAYNTGTGTVDMTLSNGSTADQKITLDLSAITQYSGSSTIAGTANGNAAGTLSSISIDSSGIITGTYSNGIKQAEAQVAVAQFNNASGLTKTGDSLYQISNNSGDPNVKTAADLGVKITPSALEMSNVDVANEFTDMIITQRGFQSNSKIITVSDEMLETLINMKR